MNRKMKRKISTKKVSKDLLNELKQQLNSIGLRLKPSYLWEISSEDSEHVFNFCLQFNIDLNGLNVIQIKDLIFITNIGYLLKHLRNLLKESFVSFIDVSPDLRLPQILKTHEIDSKKSILRTLLNELEVKSNQTIVKIESINDSDNDLCLICGALLGYPIIYCNNNPENGNCLSCEPLCHISVQSLDENNSIENIYSFSIPEIFRHHFDSDINLWFESLRGQPSGAKSLSFKSETKTLPFVLT